MEANTLRIGNIVNRKWLLNGKSRRIVVDGNDICACVLHPNAFEPIPLTDDFELINKSFRLIPANGGYILERVSVIVGYGQPKREEWHTISFVANVNDLQNIYFYLTGEDLTIQKDDYRKCPNCGHSNTKKESANSYVCRYCESEKDTEF